MKTFLIIILVAALAIVLYPKSYTSSPGFVPAEQAAEFERTAPKCYGYSYLTNAMQVAADAPGQSLCFGWLASL